MKRLLIKTIPRMCAKIKSTNPLNINTGGNMGNIEKSLLKLFMIVSIIGSLISPESIFSSNNNTKSKISKTTETGEFYVFDLDRFRLPFDRKGIIADVNTGSGSGGYYDNISVLFS